MQRVGKDRQDILVSHDSRLPNDLKSHNLTLSEIVDMIQNPLSQEAGGGGGDDDHDSNQGTVLPHLCLYLHYEFVTCATFQVNSYIRRLSEHNRIKLNR